MPHKFSPIVRTSQPWHGITPGIEEARIRSIDSVGEIVERRWTHNTLALTYPAVTVTWGTCFRTFPSSPKALAKANRFASSLRRRYPTLTVNVSSNSK